MEELRDEGKLQQARSNAIRAAAKGERAAEAMAEQAAERAEVPAEPGGESGPSLRVVGESGYEEFVDEATDGGRKAATALEEARLILSDLGSGVWQAARVRIKERPLRSVLIALAAGFIIGGILVSRD